MARNPALVTVHGDTGSFGCTEGKGYNGNTAISRGGRIELDKGRFARAG